MRLDQIEESYKIVYYPLAKAIGLCLADIGSTDIKINATSVISAIISVGIEIGSKANSLAISQGKNDLIDGDHIARFIALSLTNSFSLSPQVKQALNNVALAGFKESPKEKSN
jgi:hypothetical protein